MKGLSSILLQISAFGGTMGLFTGISLVTFVEIAYWIVRFLTFGMIGESGSSEDRKISVGALPDPNRKGAVGIGIQPAFSGPNPFPGYS